MTVMVAGLSGALMTLDMTVVNVALGAIGASLNASLAGLQWVVNGYTLAFAAILLSAGALSDRLGRKGVFLLGVAAFTVASAACALAPSTAVLTIARVVQGAGGALVMGTGLALIAGAYAGDDPKHRQEAVGVFTAIGAASATLGPLVGGALVDAGGWRMIFLINLPLGLLVIALTLWAVPAQPKPARGRIDVVGSVLAALLLFSLNYGLLTGAGQDWDRADVVVTLLAAPILLVAFLLMESRTRGRPMLDTSLFRIPTFTGAIVLSFASRITSFGLFPFLILWLEDVLGHAPFQVGLMLLMLTIPLAVVAGVSGNLARVVSLRVLIWIGMVIIGTGLISGSVALGPHSDWPALIPCLIMVGIGSGLVMPHMLGLAVGVVPAERAGMASGLSNTFFPLGTAVGVAAFGVIMYAAVATRITDPAAASLVVAGRLHALSALPGGAAMLPTATQAFVTGLSQILLIGGIGGLAAGFAALFLVRAKDLRQSASVAS